MSTTVPTLAASSGRSDPALHGVSAPHAERRMLDTRMATQTMLRNVEHTRASGCCRRARRSAAGSCPAARPAGRPWQKGRSAHTHAEHVSAVQLRKPQSRTRLQVISREHSSLCTSPGFAGPMCRGCSAAKGTRSTPAHGRCPRRRRGPCRATCGPSPARIRGRRAAALIARHTPDPQSLSYEGSHALLRSGGQEHARRGGGRRRCRSRPARSPG